MKTNRCKDLLAAGQIPVGHMLLEFNTPGIAQILDGAGVDFVLIDLEHSRFTSHDVAAMVAWFKATAIAPFVRIPQIQYQFISRTLDAGALGIMVPNVKSAAEARAVVDAAKYAPLGQRGVILGNAQTDYRSVDPPEFLARSNATTTVICQIESEEGLDDLEGIATTPGVDILWVGHFDLTQSMGIPGQFHHRRFLDALERVADVARAHGLAAGIQPGNLAQAQEWIELGYNVISYGGDMAVYQAALAQGVAGVRELAGGA